MWRYFRELRVKYLIVMVAERNTDYYVPDGFVVEGIVEAYQDNLRLVFKNGMFEVFEIIKYADE